jgi:hypothetical protein
VQRLRLLPQVRAGTIGAYPNFLNWGAPKAILVGWRAKKASQVKAA